MTFESLIGFVATSALVLTIPGPSFLYVIAISRQRNVIDAVWNILGMGFGGIVIAALTAFGVATLINGFPLVLVILKIAGVTYFFGLGLRMLWRAYNFREEKNLAEGDNSELRTDRPFIQGFSVEMLNPKALLFFISLLPQFVTPGGYENYVQLLILGLIFVTLQVFTDLTVLYLTVNISLSGRFAKKYGAYASGVIFIGLGIFLIFSI
jgi:leucine efflux protein